MMVSFGQNDTKIATNQANETTTKEGFSKIQFKE